MADANPNQGFDNYAKEFSLRIEALRATGEYQKALADADLTRAKTLDQLERTRTTALINQTLRRTLREIEQAEHKAELQRDAATRRAVDLQYLVSGNRPISLAQFYARLAAVEWIASRGGGTVLFTALPEQAKSGDNFISVSQAHPETELLPSNIENLAQAIAWMRAHLHYFKAGYPLHQFFVEQAERLNGMQAKIVADIQAALDAARAGEYSKLQAIKPFLEIK